MCKIKRRKYKKAKKIQWFIGPSSVTWYNICWIHHSISFQSVLQTNIGHVDVYVYCVTSLLQFELFPSYFAVSSMFVCLFAIFFIGLRFAQFYFNKILSCALPIPFNCLNKNYFSNKNNWVKWKCQGYCECSEICYFMHFFVLSFVSFSLLFIFFLLFATPSFAIAKENNAKRKKNLKNLLFDYIFTLPELISKKKVNN